MPSEFSDDPFGRRADQLFRDLELDTEQRLEAPPPPSEIRRRGERRRTRRRTGYAAGALGLAAIATTSVMTLNSARTAEHATPAGTSSPSIVRPTIATSTQSQTPVPSATRSGPVLPTSSGDAASSGATGATGASATARGTATDPASAASTTTPASAGPSDTPSASAPSSSAANGQPDASWANVADTQLVYDAAPGDLSQYATGQGSEASKANVSWCTGPFSSLGAQSTFSRNFNGSRFQAAVFVFDFATTDQASAGRSLIRQWFARCPARLTSLGYQSVTLTPAQEITPQTSVTPSQISYRTISGIDLSNQAGYQQDLLLQAGRRVEWVQYITTGDPTKGTPPSTSPDQMPGTARAQEMLAALAG